MLGVIEMTNENGSHNDLPYDDPALRWKGLLMSALGHKQTPESGHMSKAALSTPLT
jgi:hypothetical protein